MIKKLKKIIINFSALTLNKSKLYSSILYNFCRFFPLNKMIEIFKLKPLKDLTDYKPLAYNNNTLNHGYFDLDSYKPIKKKKKLHPIGIAKFTKAYIISGSELVYKNRVAYRQLFTFGHELINFKFVDYNGLIEVNENYVLNHKLPVAKKTISNALVLTGTYERNWYHWLIEILPKLYLANINLKQEKDLKIIVSEKIFKSKTHIESLKLFSGNQEIIQIQSRLFYELKDLYVFESPSVSNRKRKKLLNFKLDDGNFYRDVFISYRQFIIDKLLDDDIYYGDNIYLFRDQNKRPFNQPQVIELLNEYDFRSIDLMGLSFKEQVNLFNKAKFIIGPTGAAWTNILFSDKYLKSIIFTPINTEQNTSFANLASVSGSKLYFQELKIHEDHWQTYMKSNSFAEVNILELKHNLNKLLS